MSLLAALASLEPAVPLSVLGAVLSASLLGSLHCAGMCGPFVAVFSAGEGGTLKSRALGHLAYHLGRASTYIALGAMGGAAGSAIDWVGDAAGFVELAAIISGVLVVLWGLGALLPGLRIPSPLERFLGRSLVKLGTKPRVVRASVLGILTPALPCGWLYAFVVTAAGTGSALGGALLMATFWVGTVPALVGVGALIGRMGDSLRRRMPLVTGTALIVIGLVTVVSRSVAPKPTRHALGEGDVLSGEQPSCH